MQVDKYGPHKRNSEIIIKSQKLLCLEADRHAIRITVNSFGTELSKCDRQSLFTDFGNLHPEGQSRLMQCESFDEVRNILSTYPDLQKLTSATSFHEIDKVTDLTNLQVCSSRLHRECGDLSQNTANKLLKCNSISPYSTPSQNFKKMSCPTCFGCVSVSRSSRKLIQTKAWFTQGHESE